MTVTLSINDVPEELAERLKQRAERNRRSLQGELLAIIEAAAASSPTTIEEFSHFVGKLGFHTPAGESARMVREDRDDPRR